MNKVTLSGADELTSIEWLAWAVTCPGVEIGFLYSATPEGRNRYPSFAWLATAMFHARQNCALHICGSAAREELKSGNLSEIVEYAKRIQINGIMLDSELIAISAKYPNHKIITQHKSGNEHLIRVDAANHAILLDSSGGRGLKPKHWNVPLTVKAVGFAGGLNADNIVCEVSNMDDRGRSDSWIDMETGLRNSDDLFETRLADDVIFQITGYRI